jgi:hypothetical protein
MSLIYPMFAMVVLTVIVAGAMFRSRVRAVKSKDVSLSFFKTYQGNAPEDVLVTARHFTNLFEAPVLFYVACLAAMIIEKTGVAVVALAWGYVVLRAVHAYVHLGSNAVFQRMRVYMASWIILLTLWIALLF